MKAPAKGRADTVPGLPDTLQCLALLTCLVVSGCGFFGLEDRTDEYLVSNSTAMLSVPDDMRVVPPEAVEPLPATQDISQTTLQLRNVQMPQALLNPLRGEVRLQSLGQNTWLVLELSIAQLWPRLRGFIADNKFPVTRVDNTEGVIDSNWLQLKTGSQREKYRFFIKSGLRSNTSELHVLQAGEQLGSNWPKDSLCQECTRQMLLNFVSYLAALNTQPAPVSATLASIRTAERMAVTTDQQGTPVILLGVSYGRAWASTAFSLERSGIYILDRNRDAGEFIIAYDPGKKVKKTDARQGNQSDNDSNEALSSKELADLTRKFPRFQLLLTEDDQYIRVTPRILDSEADPAIILALIRHIAAFIA